MTWNTLPTLTAGTKVTATHWNQLVQNINHLGDMVDGAGTALKNKTAGYSTSLLNFDYVNDANGSYTTTSDSFEVVNAGVTALTLTTVGGDVLFIISAHQTGADTAYFDLHNGTALISGNTLGFGGSDDPDEYNITAFYLLQGLSAGTYTWNLYFRRAAAGTATVVASTSTHTLQMFALELPSQ